ncbi:TetR/AcrR family transcriptional regulator [Actinomadura flavalba]|uniref:TetR/AcrR family transcriptional regulator n=1 Tax=Actinomadura flavalba TaxID=1120938 RepID=UPI00036A5ED6|nr:TetR/AcrR family transcriptional regulator [Actinomadura flavalba]
MPRPRREEQLLSLAVDEFGRHGYANVSMAQVAARAGVTKPLLYQYFGSKDGLYAACVERIGAPLSQAVAAVMAERSPDTPLAVLRAVFGCLEGQHQAWFLLYDQTLPPGSPPAAVAARYRDAIDALAARGTAEIIGFGDPLDADLLKRLWNNAVGSLVVWWTQHPDESAAAMAARCARVFAAISASGVFSRAGT